MSELIPALSIFLAIAATVVIFVRIVPEKKANTLNKFGKFLHDTVNFKYLIIEKVLQAMYIFSTAFVLVFGFLLLFYVEEGYTYYSYYGGYYTTPDQWYGGYGIMLMLLGPIAIRLAYELGMMFLLLVKNVMQINAKLKAPEEGQPTPEVPPVPYTPGPFVTMAAPTAPAAPAKPIEPAVPAEPAAPTEPAAPAEPAEPEAPSQSDEPATQNSLAPVFCRRCGTKLQENHAYCCHCGTPVK